MANEKLSAARKAKNDEFYTQLTDIEKELGHYTDHFRDKVVFLNCDDPEWSNFWRYFELNFDHLGLRKLIATHYEAEKPSYKMEITRGIDLDGDGRHTRTDTVTTPLTQNGDFRSPESLALLDEADIVVTNPPFSLFREYVSLLVEHGKDFIILGNNNSVTYKEVWALIQSGRVWLGTQSNKSLTFAIPDSYNAPTDARRDPRSGLRLVTVPAVSWFTTLDHAQRHEEIPLFRSYHEDPSKYPTYANYDAIEVAKVADIPVDYDGEMGVPITFLGKFNPEQFELVGYSGHVARPMAECVPPGSSYSKGGPRFYVADGDSYRRLYDRIIIIRRKKAAA